VALDSGSRKHLADIQKASQLLQRGQRTDALLVYHDVKQAMGRQAPVQFALGQLCEQIGDIDQAITHYIVAAEESPDTAQYQSTLGIAYLNSGDRDRALETLEQALGLNPDMPDVLHGLGIYHMRRDDYEAALEFLQRSCELNRSDPGVLTNLATTLTRLNRHDEALIQARKAVRLNDADPDTHLALCTTLSEMGEMDEAVQHLENTIRKHKDFGLAYDLLARIKKFSSEDTAFIKKAEKVLDRGMSARNRFCLHFALGKMHDDCGEHDQAFEHYRQGNLLQHVDYDIDDDKSLLKRMKKAFTRSSLESFAGLGHQSSKPVFIVGMPRSGTTLMERIIASHPHGAGAGELSEIAYLSREILPASERRRAAARAREKLTAENIQSYAERYLAILQQGHQDARRVVDKMPTNFYFVGVIASLFPNATIINAIRHPLDISLSCYFQTFSDLPWSNDLKMIAKVYSLYREAMDYWHQVLPEGKILDLQYEQLVEDPEGQSRRMLDACGLDWDESVLQFFRKKSVVKTASVAQSRQPIYKSSKARWMKYAAHIDVLAADLSEYLQEDASLLAEHGVKLPSPSALGKFKRLLK
jgi:tetratricopeptide (TPR) repeat protein